MARYDGKNLTYFSPREGFCANTVRAMIEDGNRNIWFATSGGVCRYDGKSFASITQRDGLDSNQVWCILLDKKGTLWLGTEGGVNAYDRRGVTSFALPSLSSNEVPVKATYLAPKLVNWILEDRAGNLWFCTNGKGVFCIDGKSVTGFSRVDGLCDDFVQTTYEDKAGNLWFGSRFGGLSRYNRKTNAFANFRMAEGLSAHFIWTLLQDKAGTLWIATAGGGLSSVDEASMKSSKPAFAVNDEKHGLRNRSVQSLLERQSGKAMGRHVRRRISQAERIFCQYHQGRTVGVKSNADRSHNACGKRAASWPLMPTSSSSQVRRMAAR